MICNVYIYLRFHVDQRYMIVIVKNAIRLVEIKDADAFIEWELLKNFDLLTYLLFRFGLYDEINDTIMLLQAFKVSELVK